MRFCEIYEALTELAEPFALPEEWRWLPIDSDCRLLPDPAAAFTALRTRFLAETLLASGVAVRREGEVVLHPLLVTPESGFIALRKADGRAYDLATAAGCLRGAIPILRMLHDRDTRRGIAATADGLASVRPKMRFGLEFAGDCAKILLED